LDITERKRAEKALKVSLHEKEVLLKEIHHRVKNNMQVISSLVSLQADGSKDETVREVLKDVTYRIRSMALVHEKLYQSADLAHIDFAEYSRSLMNYLWRAHGAVAANIRLTLNLAPVSLPVDTAVPCGLILNELGGNALKHAFRGRSEGEVTVALQKRWGWPYPSLCERQRRRPPAGFRLARGPLAGSAPGEVAVQPTWRRGGSQLRKGDYV
jgi:two-component sensor histidine kinase